MNIAYLILAHNTPNHLQRLIASLRGPGRKVFVHIDRKSDIRLFKRPDTPQDVCFIEEQVPVFWGDFSGVQATINLMRRALSDSADFDYLILLSGSDYPIRGQEYIRSYFQRLNGQEFIGGVPMPNEEVFKPVSRLTSYRFRTPSNRRLPRKCVSWLNRVAGRPRFQRDYRAALDPLVPYGGSQWWALSAHACLYILKFIEDHPRVVKFFKNTHVPDESFFHTIVGNSPFKSRMTMNPTAAHWVPRQNSPSTLNVETLRVLLGAPVLKTGLYGTGEVLFLRKFPDDSEDLVGIVEETVRPEGEPAGVC